MSPASGAFFKSTPVRPRRGPNPFAGIPFRAVEGRSQVAFQDSSRSSAAMTVVPILRPHPLIAIVSALAHDTGRNIRSTGEFVMNIMAASGFPRNHEVYLGSPAGSEQDRDPSLVTGQTAGDKGGCGRDRGEDRARGRQ